MAPTTNFALGGGRALPPLVFVTDERALGAAVKDAVAASALLQSLAATADTWVVRVNAAGRPVLEVLTEVRGQVQALRKKTPAIEGIVLVGGYDVLPSLRTDCVPPGVMVDRDLEPDRFIVWNDDAYGDLEGKGVPTIPVSRAPDGGSAQFLRRILGAEAPARPEAKPSAAFGMRDKFRPFADAVYRMIGGPNAKPLVCAPRHDSIQSPWERGRNLAYLVLHGDAKKPRRFVGQEKLGGVSVRGMSTRTFPPLSGGVLFAGSCYGALIVDHRASDPIGRDRPLGARTAKRSIALRALKNGATAFVGSTGIQYVPIENRDPVGYLAEPLHVSFWQRYLGGMAPAAALLEAKLDYLKAIPHLPPETNMMLALECKTFRQMTCLGLGW